jgi:hypothetical protein
MYVKQFRFIYKENLFICIGVASYYSRPYTVPFSWVSHLPYLVALSRLYNLVALSRLYNLGR